MEVLTTPLGSLSLGLPRQCFKTGDAVQVKDGRRWYPADIVAVDSDTGLHKVRYGKRKKWDGLFFYGDLRPRVAQRR